jgi:hypothetical protein
MEQIIASPISANLLLLQHHRIRRHIAQRHYELHSSQLSSLDGAHECVALEVHALEGRVAELQDVGDDVEEAQVGGPVEHAVD